MNTSTNSKLIKRQFYIVYHKNCKTYFSRSILNEKRTYAIKEFIQDNIDMNPNFNWKKAKKEGWICAKVMISYE